MTKSALPSTGGTSHAPKQLPNQIVKRVLGNLFCKKSFTARLYGFKPSGNCRITVFALLFLIFCSIAGKSVS